MQDHLDNIVVEGAVETEARRDENGYGNTRHWLSS